MCGSIFALCIDPFLAIALANIWAELLVVAEDFDRLAAAGGLVIRVHRCAVVPLRCFTDVEGQGCLRFSSLGSWDAGRKRVCALS